MITESQMLSMFRSGDLPILNILDIELIQTDVELDKRRYDAIIQVRWGKIKAMFIVEIKARSNPKSLQNAIAQIQSEEFPSSYFPMIVMPYLSEEQLLTLKSKSISGMDLSGNCVIIAPDSLAIFRTGQPNSYPDSTGIKNIYRKNSSMVTRVFFSKPEFELVSNVLQEINRRNPLVRSGLSKPMTLSTVSKALKSLDEDLIISRKNAISLLQPDKAMLMLSQNYTRPKTKNTIKMRVDNLSDAMSLLMKNKNKQLQFTATGLSTAPRLAVTDQGENLSVYCTNTQLAARNIVGDLNSRFSNLELLETLDERVYFDTSENSSFIWSSPIQTFLELCDGDKRDQEVSNQVKTMIINQLGNRIGNKHT